MGADDLVAKHWQQADVRPMAGKGRRNLLELTHRLRNQARNDEKCVMCVNEGQSNWLLTSCKQAKVPFTPFFLEI